MLIRNADGSQGVGQRVLVELRVRSLPRHLPDIRDQGDIGCRQQRGEFFVASVGVADREKWTLHDLPLPRAC
jgi:hypothetical protein